MSKVILYDKKEKEFSNRGLGTLIDTIECTVKEKKNGMYEAYLEYPLYAPKASFLIEENIFYCSTPRGMQPFRIYRTVPDEETKIKSIYAEHIFYDLASNFIEDTNIVGRNGIGAIQQLLEKTQYSNDFIGFSDIDNIANSRQVRKSPVAAILDTDEDECILNRWGGELQRDKFQVRLLTRYGADRGVVIKYGKNLTGLIVDCDYSSITTRIMPQGYNGLFLPEKYVDSPLIDNYVFPRISKIEFSDIKVKDENSEDGYETKEQAYEALRNEVKKLYSESKIDMPKTTMTVNMIALQDTEEYKNLAILERLYPFDTVTIKHSKLNMNIKVDMNYYEWDSLADKYISMEFASDKSSFVETTATINNVKKKMDELQQSVLQEAKQTATGLINNGLGGYVLKTRDELLIMDTDDINTAQKIWRWNMGGLGYSSTGYNGEFGLAMTADGAIVADFITTGSLNAGIITTGIIKSKDSKSYFNLDNGELVLGKGRIVINNIDDKKVMWVDENGHLATDTLEVFGNSACGVNLHGKGAKYIHFKSDDNKSLFMDFYRGETGHSRMGIYAEDSLSERSYQFFIEPGSNVTDHIPQVIVRGINSTAEANEEAELQVHGRIRAVGKLLIGHGSTERDVGDILSDFAKRLQILESK